MSVELNQPPSDGISNVQFSADDSRLLVSSWDNVSGALADPEMILSVLFREFGFMMCRAIVFGISIHTIIQYLIVLG